jgi:hypothetical protein
MASGTKTLSEARKDVSALCSAAKGAALDALPAAIGLQAAILRTRRGQTLAPSFDGVETAFIVRAGVLTLQLTLPDSSRQIVALLFSGDVFRSNFIPPHAEATLASAGVGEVWRMRLASLDKLAASDRQSRAISTRHWQTRWRARLSMSPRSASSVASREW